MPSKSIESEGQGMRNQDLWEFSNPMMDSHPSVYEASSRFGPDFLVFFNFGHKR